ncbi:MAG: BamA/TamA family outer membrane protein [Leptolyngbyaceae cyanobacterium CSU_1_3]|nr:BamA/TamA family outer membrane protein [Leptolyngbyaceae cyanobacterium CSU_1_3]
MLLRSFVAGCRVLAPTWAIVLTANPIITDPAIAQPASTQTVSTQTVIAQAEPQTLPKPNPNLDRFPQPLPTPQPLPPSDQQPTLPPAIVPTPEPAPAPVSIPVRKIEVTGSTILTPGDLTPITQPVEGRSVTLEDLRNVADAITQLYLNRGFITSRAVLVDQAIDDGLVKIRVVEGSLEKIDVEGTQRLKPDYVRSRIQLGAKVPLNKDRLEDQLRLLKADPLFENVEASLRPGTGLGQSILTLRVKESKAITGYIGVDNFSPPSVGSERLGGVFGYRNVTGIGDELSASYFRSLQGGSNVFDFSYRVPINAKNGTVQLRVSPSKSRIIASDFAAFDIRSQTTLYEVSYRQPIIRTPRQELALSLGFALQDGQTFLFNDTPFPFGIGPDLDGNSRTRVLKFGQDYVRRDPQGAWGLRSQFSLGLNVFDATTNDDPIPDGRFFSWLGQIQRVQRLSNDHLLIAQADVQLSPDSLLPSQQFVIGGGQSLRGYRQNARSGDNGFRFSLEDRISVLRDASGVPTLQVVPFVEVGSVWNKSNNPNRLINETFLAAAGLGLIWEPVPRFTIRLDYAIPFVRLTDEGNNAQDKGFFFSVGYNL